MNVVAYCRVSTNDKDQLNSLKTQQEFFEAFAKKNGLNLIRIYSDEGISGTKMKNRKALNRLMHDAQSGIFQAVLFKDVSRLARNTLDFLQCFHTLKALGIKPRFLNNGGNGMEENNSDLIITVLAAIAQEESYNTSVLLSFFKYYVFKVHQS